MRRFFIIMQTSILLLPPLLLAEQRYQRELDEAQALTLAAKQGFHPLLRHVRDNKVEPFTIYSKWYVETALTNDQERVKLEMARRNFGKELLVSLKREALGLNGEFTVREHERNAEALLELADWFNKPVGYGNAWLFTRLQDLATIPLAYLIADMDYAEEKLVQMCSKLVLSTVGIARNYQILNMEGPDPKLFSIPKIKVSNITDTDKLDKYYDSLFWSLEQTWLKKRTEITKIIPRRSTGNLKEDDREKCPRKLQFFIDDDYKRRNLPRTALALWDIKWHHFLIVGLRSRNVTYVRYFLLFRQEIRHFPTEPNRFNPMFDNGNKVVQAFRQTWRERFQNNSGIGGNAGQIYSGVLKRNVRDLDSIEEEVALMTRPTRRQQEVTEKP